MWTQSTHSSSRKHCDDGMDGTAEATEVTADTSPPWTTQPTATTSFNKQQETTTTQIAWWTISERWTKKKNLCINKKFISKMNHSNKRRRNGHVCFGCESCIITVFCKFCASFHVNGYLCIDFVISEHSSINGKCHPLCQCACALKWPMFSSHLRCECDG